MDSPINWAHQQERQAEALVSHRKFAEAIVCHRKALEFLQEAMKMTEVKEALISLQLQCNSHCRQERILKEKWKLWEIEQEKQIHEQQKMLQLRQNQEIAEKQNSLLNVDTGRDVVDNKRGIEHSQSSSLVISAENFSVSSTSSISDCGAVSKDEKTTAQELEGQVRDLQMQVLTLSQNLEDCNRENRRLQKALNDVCDFVKVNFGCELHNVFDCMNGKLDYGSEFETCADHVGPNIATSAKDDQTSSPEAIAQSDTEDTDLGKVYDNIPLRQM